MISYMIESRVLLWTCPGRAPEPRPEGERGGFQEEEASKLSERRKGQIEKRIVGGRVSHMCKGLELRKFQ